MNNQEVKFLEGQDFMNIEQLQENYENAFSNQNYQLANSLLSSILEKNDINPILDEEIIRKYYSDKIDIQLKIGAFGDATELAGQIATQKVGKNKTISTDDIKFKAFAGQAQAKSGNLWNGIMQVLRAQGQSVKIRKINKKMKADNEDELFLKKKVNDEMEKVDEIVNNLRNIAKNTKNAAEYINILYLSDNLKHFKTPKRKTVRIPITPSQSDQIQERKQSYDTDYQENNQINDKTEQKVQQDILQDQNFLSVQKNPEEYLATEDDLQTDEDEDISDSDTNQNNKIDYKQYTQKNQLQTIPELNNRMIQSIACGDNHVLMLVEGCSCSNPFSPNTDCKGILECNGGAEVFGIGDNSEAQIMGFFAANNHFLRPTQVSYFSGKKIIGLASRCYTSCAFDVDGNIYQWGRKKSDNFYIEKLPISGTMGKIKKLQLGESFYVVQNENNELYIWGSIYSMTSQTKNITVYNNDIPQKLQINGQDSYFQDFSVGKNHIIAISDSELYGMGNNEFGQLGKDYKQVKFINKLEKLSILEQIEDQSKIEDSQLVSISTGDNTSFYVYNNLLLYTGCIQDKVIQCIPQELKTEQGQNILKVYQNAKGSKNEMEKSGSFENNHPRAFGITDLGQCVVWDPVLYKNEFKVYDKTQNSTFTDMCITTDFLIMYRSMFKPSKCQLKLKTQKPQTFKPVNIQVDVYDELGHYGIKVFYPIRVYCFVSDRNNIQEDQIQILAKNKFQEQQQKYEKAQFYCYELSDNLTRSIKMSQSEEDRRIYNLELQFEQSDEYYLWVFINECPLKNNPINFECQQSPEEKLAFQKQCAQQLDKLEELKINKIIEDQKMEEKLFLLEQKEKEVFKKKNQELRDEEKQKDKEQLKLLQDQIDEMNKKLENCRTGGGYDIWAAAKVKKEYESVIQEKEELEQLIASKKYYQLDNNQNNLNYSKDFMSNGIEGQSNNNASFNTDKNLKYKVLREQKMKQYNSQKESENNYQNSINSNKKSKRGSQFNNINTSFSKGKQSNGQLKTNNNELKRRTSNTKSNLDIPINQMRKKSNISNSKSVDPTNRINSQQNNNNQMNKSSIQQKDKLTNYYNPKQFQQNQNKNKQTLQTDESKEDLSQFDHILPQPKNQQRKYSDQGKSIKIFQEKRKSSLMNPTQNSQESNSNNTEKQKNKGYSIKESKQILQKYQQLDKIEQVSENNSPIKQQNINKPLININSPIQSKINSKQQTKNFDDSQKKIQLQEQQFQINDQQNSNINNNINLIQDKLQKIQNDQNNIKINDESQQKQEKIFQDLQSDDDEKLERQDSQKYIQSMNIKDKNENSSQQLIQQDKQKELEIQKQKQQQKREEIAKLENQKFKQELQEKLSHIKVEYDINSQQQAIQYQRYNSGLFIPPKKQSIIKQIEQSPNLNQKQTNQKLNDQFIQEQKIFLLGKSPSKKGSNSLIKQQQQNGSIVLQQTKKRKSVQEQIIKKQIQIQQELLQNFKNKNNNKNDILKIQQKNINKNQQNDSNVESIMEEQKENQQNEDQNNQKNVSLSNKNSEHQQIKQQYFISKQNVKRQNFKSPSQFGSRTDNNLKIQNHGIQGILSPQYQKQQQDMKQVNQIVQQAREEVLKQKQRQINAQLIKQQQKKLQQQEQFNQLNNKNNIFQSQLNSNIINSNDQQQELSQSYLQQIQSNKITNNQRNNIQEYHNNKKQKKKNNLKESQQQLKQYFQQQQLIIKEQQEKYAQRGRNIVLMGNSGSQSERNTGNNNSPKQKNQNINNQILIQQQQYQFNNENDQNNQNLQNDNNNQSKVTQNRLPSLTEKKSPNQQKIINLQEQFTESIKRQIYFSKPDFKHNIQKNNSFTYLQQQETPTNNNQNQYYTGKKYFQIGSQNINHLSQQLIKLKQEKLSIQESLFYQNLNQKQQSTTNDQMSQEKLPQSQKSGSQSQIDSFQSNQLQSFSNNQNQNNSLNISQNNLNSQDKLQFQNSQQHNKSHSYIDDNEFVEDLQNQEQFMEEQNLYKIQKKESLRNQQFRLNTLEQDDQLEQQFEQKIINQQYQEILHNDSQNQIDNSHNFIKQKINNSTSSIKDNQPKQYKPIRKVGLRQ